MARFPVSKLEAATRQLEAAIRLFAAGEDSVSIHTLTFAAYQLLKGLNVSAGNPPMMSERRRLDEPRATVLPTLPGLTAIAANIVVGESWAAANFAKHADHDPGDVFQFDDSHAEHLLYVACAKRDELAGARTPWTKAFLAWSIAGHPELFAWSDAMRNFGGVVAALRRESDRRGFFDRVRDLFARGAL